MFVCSCFIAVVFSKAFITAVGQIVKLYLLCERPEMGRIFNTTNILNKEKKKKKKQQQQKQMNKHDQRDSHTEHTLAGLGGKLNVS